MMEAAPITIAPAARATSTVSRVEPPVVITRAICVLGSKVKPTATTCGELSGRSVVSMARWRSVRNAKASLVSRAVEFAITAHASAGHNRSRE